MLIPKYQKASGPIRHTTVYVSQNGQTYKTVEAAKQANNELIDNFIEDIWENEYGNSTKGYDPKTQLYYPYDSAEGGIQTVGPGFKLVQDGQGNKYSFTISEAKKGLTKEQINEKLRNQAALQVSKVREYLFGKGNLPTQYVPSNVFRGLMDLRYQVGALGGWEKLKLAVLANDYEGMVRESKVTFKGSDNKIKEDTRRNNLRAEKYFRQYKNGGIMNYLQYTK